MAEETKAVLAEIGVHREGLYSKGLTEIDLLDYCLLINLSDYSLDRVLPRACADRLIQRPLPDPFGGSLEEYRRSLHAIKHMILRELCQGDVPLPCQNGD